MQIPTSLKIGGIRYRVKLCGEKDLDANIAGRIIPEKGVIKVLKGLDAFTGQTLWHEIFHAINMEMEEEKVEFLAQSVFQIVIDNPQMFTMKVKKKRKRGDAKNGKK